MAMIPELKSLFGDWIAAVARAVNSVTERYVHRRQILLSEGDDHTFTAKVTPVRKGPALPDVSFRLSHGRPNPLLPADYFAAAGLKSCWRLARCCFVRSTFRSRRWVFSMA
jgi:general secretion pathway protein L